MVELGSSIQARTTQSSIPYRIDHRMTVVVNPARNRAPVNYRWERGFKREGFGHAQVDRADQPALPNLNPHKTGA